MKTLSFVCRIYLLALLLVAALLSPPPYSLAAIALLTAAIYPSIRPLPPRLNIGLLVGTMVLSPLVVEPVLGYLTPYPITRQGLAALSILPVLFSLDNTLIQNAGSRFDSNHDLDHDLTPTAKALLTTVATILLISLILDNRALLFTDVVLGLYLVIIFPITLLGVPGKPISLPSVWRRTIAGTGVSLSVPARNKAFIPLHCRVTPEDEWVRTTPQAFTTDRVTSLDFHLTPPLAGPSRPKFHVSTIDPWGLVQRNQTIEPVGLQVIPRAKFADWLARQFLEQSGTWTGVPLSLLPEVRLLKKGAEYYDSRNYQPGDMLKDIDWKHSLKLNRLIIKEYIEASERVAIIAVNLAVSNAEEADRLAGNLISTALTLAQENITAALAAYDHEKVIETTPVLSPREILHRSLALVNNITTADFTPRVLQTADVTKLRWDITHLKKTTSEPAKRLLNMLQFEYEAIKKSAQDHPASLALTTVAEHTPGPAIVIVVSEMNHDTEALAMTLDNLARLDFARISAGNRPR